MLLIHAVAILLTINLILLHGNKIALFYRWAYTKLIKPKFELGESVMIEGIPYTVINISKTAKLYTYLCIIDIAAKGRDYSVFIHQSKIKKKTGILKELE